jgi:hypothetical protein
VTKEQEKARDEKLATLNTMDDSPVVAMNSYGGDGNLSRRGTAVLANGRMFATCKDGWREIAPVPGTPAGDLVYKGGQFEWPRGNVGPTE